MPREKRTLATTIIAIVSLLKETWWPPQRAATFSRHLISPLIVAQALPRNRCCQRRNLRAFKHEQHGLIACARLTKGDEGLILRRVVEGVERIHVRELDDENAIRLPMATLRRFVR